MPEKYIVVIGDIVHSRMIKDRVVFDRQLQQTLSHLSERNQSVLSPYTLTIGDEIQAVFSSADDLFRDAIFILASIYPQKMRFSYGVDVLSKPINPIQAIGMDGPAFHVARDGIEERLKKSGDLFYVSGEGITNLPLLRSCLQLLSFQIKDWKPNRLQTFKRLQENVPVKVIAEELHVSEQAIYKTINAGALEVIRQLFDEISMHLNQELKARV
jgi:SatD family (SatD)